MILSHFFGVYKEAGILFVHSFSPIACGYHEKKTGGRKYQLEIRNLLNNICGQGIYVTAGKVFIPCEKSSEILLKHVKIFTSQVFLPKKSLKFPYMEFF